MNRERDLHQTFFAIRRRRPVISRWQASIEKKKKIE